MRKPVPPPARTRSRTMMLPAPTHGWVSATDLSKPQPESASRLENFFPQEKSVRVRGGSQLVATIGEACKSLFSYQNGVVEQLFAATATAIYNVTTPASPTVPPPAVFANQSSGDYSTALFSTVGGTFLIAANGTNPRLVYDGVTWSATAFTITGVNTAKLSHVWVYKNRLFFVEKGTFNAWFLPVDSIGGNASQISLAGVFQRGGELLTGATWSIESGDGLNDRCIFISSNGEVVVFQGIDPSSPATWAMVGRYDIAPLLGKNAFLRIAGDVLLLTTAGAVPLSMALSRDRAALSLSAISKAIEPDWKAEAELRPRTWTCAKWPEMNMTIVALPAIQGAGQYCFVINNEIGAWAKYTGWDVNCVTVFRGGAYFGTSTGEVLQAEAGGDDNGNNYTAVYVGQFENWGMAGNVKVAQLVRASFIASVPFLPKISIATNHNTVLPTPPNSPSTTGASQWDAGVWDNAIWDSGGVQSMTTKWHTVSGYGSTMAPVVQMTCGGKVLPDAQIISNEVQFSTGGNVV